MRILSAWTILLLMLVQPLAAQQRFDSPEAALEKLGVVLASGAQADMVALFGPSVEKILDAEPAARGESLRLLNKLYQERKYLAPCGEDCQVLRLGMEGWPFPIPLAMGDGKYFFDTERGLEEVANRRIGRNELIAIETCYRLVDAQEAYKLRDPDGDGVREYASKLASSEGQRDGLYWAQADADAPSPLQDVLSEAWHYAEGRVKGSPWFGYHFKMLPGQAAQAVGGAYDYSINGHQVAGWAVVAYPANYPDSGLTTFLVNQNGVIYQKDLGAQTRQTAEAMTLFAPDDSWAVVEERI